LGTTSTKSVPNSKRLSWSNSCPQPAH